MFEKNKKTLFTSKEHHTGCPRGVFSFAILWTEKYQVDIAKAKGNTFF
jgi:hypothetical protein